MQIGRCISHHELGSQRSEHPPGDPTTPARDVASLVRTDRGAISIALRSATTLAKRPPCTPYCSASPPNSRRRPAASRPRHASARWCSSSCSARSAPSDLSLDTATVYALRYQLGLYGAGLVSYLVAATGTWICNRLWTFRGSGSGPAHRQWARFLAANAVGFVLNRGTYALLITFSHAVRRAADLRNRSRRDRRHVRELRPLARHRIPLNYQRIQPGDTYEY